MLRVIRIPEKKQKVCVRVYKIEPLLKPEFQMSPLLTLLKSRVCQYLFFFVRIEEKASTTPPPAAVQQTPLKRGICVGLPLCRAREAPPLSPNAFTYAHMWLTDQSFLSRPLSCDITIFYHSCFHPELVISIEGTAAKPVGASDAQRPNTSQALFNASVSKHGADCVVPQHVNIRPPAECGWQASGEGGGGGGS